MEHRPWGWFETLSEGPGYLVKHLCVRAGLRLSRQRHRHRCEHWVVVAGNGQLECADALIEAVAGTSLFIPQGAVHRATAGDRDLLIVEVQQGELLCEHDIERLEDDFGRLEVP